MVMGLGCKQRPQKNNTLSQQDSIDRKLFPETGKPDAPPPPPMTPPSLDELSSYAKKNIQYLKVRKVPVYTIDSTFYPFLDTVINSEKKCIYFDPYQIGFLYDLCDFDFAPKEEMDRYKDYDVFSLATENIYTYDYSKCIGIFEYKGFRFICDSICNTELLKKTNSYAIVKYFFNENKVEEEPFNDDRWSDWYFLYKKGNIKLYGYHPCMQKIRINK